MPASNSRHRLLVGIAKISVVLALLGFTGARAYRELSGSSLQLMSLRPAFLVSALLAGMLVNVAHIVVWQSITRRLGCALPWRRGAFAWSVSELGKYVPGKVWLLLGKIYFYRRRETPTTTILAASLLEGGAAILAQCLLGLTLVGTFGTTALEPFAAAAFVALGILGYVYLSGPLARRLLPVKFRPIVEITARHTTAITALYALNFLVQGIAFALLVLSFAPMAWGKLAYVVGAYLLACSVGSLALLSPAGMGIREAALVLGLGALPGLPTAVLALTARLWVTVAELLVIGAAVVWLREAQPVEKDESEVPRIMAR